jgi:uncharacterized protein (TIGR02231 family)
MPGASEEISMKSIVLGLLISTALAGTALAADFTPASKIDAVTVYLQGADVFRLANVTLPKGEHRVILSDLPATIDPQSIRVEGLPSVAGALAVVSIDSENQYIGDAALDQQRLALEAEIQTLMDERAVLDKALADAGQQRQFLMSLADKQLSPQSGTEPAKTLDVAGLASLLDLISTRLAALTTATQTAELRQRDIDKAVAELGAKINELAPGQNYQTALIINVETTADVTADLRINYRVNEAGWSPYYDAKLNIGTKVEASAIELIQRAEVVQSSSENWDNVKLTLSTARPSGSTSAPELSEDQVLPFVQPEPLAAAAPAEAVTESDLAPRKELQEFGNDTAKPELKQREMVNLQRQAEVEAVGFQANYKIESRVSVGNSGQSKKVRINSANLTADLEAVSVPRLDPAAYLTAKFKIGGTTPQMAGLVNLYLDGIYVGQGSLPLLSPGEETELGFGVDDRIKVTRKEIKSLSGEEGIITSSKTADRAWSTTIESLHDRPMTVTVFDRIPYSTSDDIKVTEIADMTPPTTRDYEKKRGVHLWKQALEPGAKTEIITGYRVTWPSEMQVGMVD